MSDPSLQDANESQSIPCHVRFPRAVYIAIAFHFGTFGASLFASIAMQRTGFYLGEIFSLLLFTADSFARAISHSFAIQAILMVLWRGSGTKRFASRNLPLPVFFMFAAAYVITQVMPIGVGWLGSLFSAASFFQAGASAMVWLQFLVSLAVIPSLFISFYVLRPLFDAQYRYAQYRYAQYRDAQYRDAQQLDTQHIDTSQQSATLIRPRGWSIVGLMLVTACFALTTVALVQTRRLMEETASLPDVFGNEGIVQAFGLIVGLLEAMFVFLIAAFVFVLPRQSKIHRNKTRNGILCVLCILFLIRSVLTVSIGMYFNDGGSSIWMHQRYTIAFDVGHVAGLAVANLWFFKHWREAGYGLDIATNELLPQTLSTNHLK